MATIAMFNEICKRSPTDALTFADQSGESKLNWAATRLREGTWQLPDGTFPVVPWQTAELPETIQSFNLVLQREGVDAALSFAAWGTEKKLEWAAAKLRAGEWNPGQPGMGEKPKNLPIRMTVSDEKTEKWRKQRKLNLLARRDANRKRARGGTGGNGKKSKK